MHAETEYMRLRERVKTDKARFEEEILETPMLLLDATEHAAAALQIRDACKQDLERISSEEAKLLREEEKASEQRILSLLPSNAKVVAASAALEDAKHDAAVWQGLATAFSEKASLLRRVAEMVVAGYSSIASPLSSTRADMAAERRDSMGGAGGFRPRGPTPR